MLFVVKLLSYPVFTLFACKIQEPCWLWGHMPPPPRTSHTQKICLYNVKMDKGNLVPPPPPNPCAQWKSPSYTIANHYLHSPVSFVGADERSEHPPPPVNENLCPHDKPRAPCPTTVFWGRRRLLHPSRIWGVSYTQWQYLKKKKMQCFNFQVCCVNDFLTKDICNNANYYWIDCSSISITFLIFDFLRSPLSLRMAFSCLLVSSGCFKTRLCRMNHKSLKCQTGRFICAPRDLYMIEQ